jgi:hypothetical protein
MVDRLEEGLGLDPDSSDAGGDPAEGPKGKEFQRDRYKRQRDEALNTAQQTKDLFQSVLQRQSALEGKIDQFISTQTPPQEQTQPDPNNPWSSFSDTDVLGIINNPEQKPELVANAQLEIQRRQLDRMGKNIRQEVTSEVNQAMSVKEGLRSVNEQVYAKYGPEAFDPSGALFNKAKVRYQEFEQRYGEKEAANRPELLHHSYILAADELGYQKPSERQQEEKSDSSPKSNQAKRTPPKSGPPPADIPEGLPEGHAEAVNQREAQVKKGDLNSAIRGLVGDHFPDLGNRR